MRRSVLAAVLLGAAALQVQPALAGPVKPAYVIDGDTIRVGSTTVRLLGIDTPEHGRCGFGKASAKTRALVADGVRLRHRMGRDRYGRALAYVQTAAGRDVGAALLRSGLAVARYDSRDGYPYHPKQATYRRLDAAHNRPDVCI